jgi:excisionase family DNA binding protein
VDNVPELLTTTELAKELRLSVKTIQRYQRDGKIHPVYTTPGGQHRWRLDDVLEELRALRQRDE